MKAWKLRRSPLARLGVVMTLAMTLGCGPHENLVHGVSFRADGAGVDLSALEPNCGCVTLRNKSASTVELVSRYHDKEVGALVLAPGPSSQIGFDWGGSAIADQYTVEVWGRQGETRTKRLVPFGDYIEGGNMVAAKCQEMECPFGSLSMDQAVSASTAGGQPVEVADGVDFMAGGQQVKVVSVIGSCGCMLISNRSKERKLIRVRASLHGQVTGEIPIEWDKSEPATTEGDAIGSFQPTQLVGFDWAGTENEDIYILSVMGEGQKGGPAGTPASQALRAQDFVRIVGQMPELRCEDDGAVFKLPVPGGGSFEVTCPFAPLNMNSKVKELQLAKPSSTSTNGSPDRPANSSPEKPATKGTP